MGCKNCNTKVQGRCDCCSLVDSDNTFKEVYYCEKCDAYICKNCKTNWIKRSIAYFIRKCHIKHVPEQPLNGVNLDVAFIDESKELFLESKENDLDAPSNDETV